MCAQCSAPEKLGLILHFQRRLIESCVYLCRLWVLILYLVNVAPSSVRCSCFVISHVFPLIPSFPRLSISFNFGIKKSVTEATLLDDMRLSFWFILTTSCMTCLSKSTNSCSWIYQIQQPWVQIKYNRSLIISWLRIKSLINLFVLFVMLH